MALKDIWGSRILLGCHRYIADAIRLCKTTADQIHNNKEVIQTLIKTINDDDLDKTRDVIYPSNNSTAETRDCLNYPCRDKSSSAMTPSALREVDNGIGR